jgi:hypothetical protein
MLSQPTFGPRTALTYVTIGSLTVVWTLVWYFTRDTELTRGQQFWIVGLGLTGLTLIVLGMLLGPLGRSARRAELPPPEATAAEAAIQKTAAANAAVPVAAAPAGAAVSAAPVQVASAAPVAQTVPVPPAPPGAVQTRPM